MRLGIVSPSSPIAPDVLERGLAKLHLLGLETKLFPHVLDKNFHLAGTDRDRAADLEAAFADPEVDAVLCSRGGYGAARLLPLLDLQSISRNKKPFLGFSDITALNLAFQPIGIPTFHAPMVISFAWDKPEWVATSLVNALRDDFTVPPDAPKPECITKGRAEGIVDGGCLTLLADSLGTPHAFCGRGKIVLIEDVHEKPHRIDAALTHLSNSGALDGAVGFVVGEMTGTNESKDPEDADWQHIVRELLVPLGKPMVSGFPFGHVDTTLTLPLGRRAELDADAGTLNYLS